MLRSRITMLLCAVAVAALTLCFGAATTNAQTAQTAPTPSDAFQVNYFTGANTTTRAQFVYVNDNAQPNTIDAFRVDASGTLTPVPGVTAQAKGLVFVNGEGDESDDD